MVWPLVWWAVVVVIGIWLLCRPFFWSGKGVEWTVPLPLVGSWPGGGMIAIAERHYSRYPGRPLVGLHIGPKPVILMRSASFINLALSVYHDHFNSHCICTNQLKDRYSTAVFTVEGQQWKEIRSKMSPQFTPAKIKAVFSRTNRTVDRVEGKLREENGNPVEMRALMLRFLIDVTSSSLFGLESDALAAEDSSLYRFLKDMFTPTLTLGVIVGMISPRLHSFFELSLLSKPLARFFDRLSSNLIAQREAAPNTQSDFLQHLIDLKAKEKDPVDAHVTYFPDGTPVPKYTAWTLPSHVWSMFSAATETTGTSMSFCLYELAANPEIQESAREEATRAVLEHGEQIPYQVLAQLTYINMVVAETLRKYPVFHVLYRKCTKSFLVPDSKVVIEEGTPILIPIYSIHHDPEFYPRPWEFRPERFTEEEKAKRPQGTYIPFGVGPRTCLGMRLALAEMTLVVCRLLAKFKLNLCSKSDHPVTLSKTSFLTAPQNGIWLSAEPL